MNGDGADELAVGSPGSGTTTNPSMGLVLVYRGGATADFGTSFTTFSAAAFGGTRHAGDLFGEAMVMGDFDGDNRADLAVGAPYYSADTGYSVGVGLRRSRAGRDRARGSRVRQPLEPDHRRRGRRPARLHGQRQPGLLRPDAHRRRTSAGTAPTTSSIGVAGRPPRADLGRHRL